MEKKDLIIGGIVLAVINCITSLGLFVTYPQMAVYAVSKDSFEIVCEQITSIKQDVSDIKLYLMGQK